MSTQENGTASNTVAGLALQTSHAIASSTNSTPIVLNTSTPHGIVNGDAFRISGHNTNFNANGIWLASVISSGQVALLQLDGSNSVGNGVGGATGFLQSLAFGSSYAIPSDGDDPTASSVNTGFIALGDRTAFAGAVAVGGYKLVGIKTLTGTDADVHLTTPWLTVTPGAPNVYTLAGVAGRFSEFTLVCGTPTWPYTGDQVELSFDTTATGDGAGTTYAVAMYYGLGQPPVTAATPVPGMRKPLQGIRSEPTDLHLGGVVPAVFFGQLTLALYVLVGATGGGQNVSFFGDYSLTAKLWRPTGYPQ